MSVGDELQQVLTDAVTEHGVPGAAAGVVVGDEVHVATHGVANVDLPTPIRPDTLFQVGSISKTFTSAAVLLLVQDGLLALDDPVAKHLPDLAAATDLDLDTITVEHLLSHQAGFDGDHLFVERLADDLGALRTARRLFPPGTGFSYNNAAFSMAGAIVEQVAGQPFESVVRERLLRPLGMRSATFRADDAITFPVAAPHWVHEGTPHVLRRAGWQPGWELGPLDRAAGGLVASVEHLLTWCGLQWTGATPDGDEVLSQVSLDRLHAPVIRADVQEDVGLDWFGRGAGDDRTVSHGGVTVGYVSELVVAPRRQVGVVALTNATNGASVNQRVRRWALERLAGIVEVDPQPDTGAPADLTGLEGRFVHSFAELVVTRGQDPGTVVVSPEARDVAGWQPPLDAPVTVTPCAAADSTIDVVSVGAPGPVRVARFGLDAAGRAEWLLWGLRRAPRKG